RRRGIGGNDGAQGDTVKDVPVIGLPDPRPDGPHDLGGFHGHSAAPAHCDMGLSGCDGSMSNRDLTGSGRDGPMPNRDVTGFGRDGSMPNREVTGSDASMSNDDVTLYLAISAQCDRFGDGRRCQGWLPTARRNHPCVGALLDEANDSQCKQQDCN